MRYRKLGRTELSVSTVAMGCWAIADGKIWGPQDQADAIGAIHAALDAGITLFDTAEGYGAGESERLLAKGLGNRRAEVVIATKASPDHHAPQDLVRACEESLRRLGTDYIDLYQLHWPSREVPFEQTMAALKQLRQQGKIRHAAVSNFGVEDLTVILEHGAIAADQLAYNVLFRAVEYAIQPQCVEHGIGILCYSPLMQGLAAGKFATVDDVPEPRRRTRHFSGQRPMARHGEAGCEAATFAALDRLRAIAGRLGVSMGNLAMAWLLHRPAVASVLAGARDADQVRRNVQAAELDLDSATVAEVDAATAELKERLGPNADMWQSVSRIR